MADKNFDFGGHIQDDTDVSPRRYNGDEELCLSPYGLILNYVGYERGKELYAALLRIANRAVEEHGGKPGIVFDVEGGRFVAINETRAGM
jgi:hypothetical protein